jgi:hypothetical protein
MHELSRRIEELSPEKRKLLDRLLEKAAAAKVATPANGEAADASIIGNEQALLANLLSFDELTASGGSKAVYRKFYDSVSAQLNAGAAGQFSFFLNFGYVPNDNPQDAAVELPAHCLNRNCTKLVLEVIGDCDLRGRDVLDVGCGRGGMVWTINK